jgi:hypothetical protein
MGRSRCVVLQPMQRTSYDLIQSRLSGSGVKLSLPCATAIELNWRPAIARISAFTRQALPVARSGPRRSGLAIASRDA